MQRDEEAGKVQLFQNWLGVGRTRNRSARACRFEGGDILRDRRPLSTRIGHLKVCVKPGNYGRCIWLVDAA